MKNLYVGIGVALGMVVGVPLLLFVANHVFYRGNDAKNVIPVYMKNSGEITVTIPDWNPRDSASLLKYKNTSYKSTLKKNGNGDLYIINFYSKECNKFFIIRLFDYPGKATYFLPDVLVHKKVIITFNNDDIKNPLYGTKDNPIPVFKYRGTVPINYADHDYDISQEEFKYNVTQYLTYLMPKEDFQKRFGK